MIVNFVRSHWAQEAVTVTESKFLHDSHSDSDVEVDVVVEGRFDGEAVLTSIEVYDRSRPATIHWVQLQVARHRYLPTNRLVLVSKSGFSKNAVAYVTKEGGWVSAVTPEIIEVGGQPVVRNLKIGRVNLTPKFCKILVERPNGVRVTVNAEADNTVFTAERVRLGFAVELIGEALNLDWVGMSLLLEASKDPERDDLTGFLCSLTVDSLGYYLHWFATDELHHVLEILVGGDFQWIADPLDLTFSKLGEKPFASGEANLFGRETIWVATPDKDGKQAKISWRTKDSKPLFDSAPANPPELKFPGLKTVTPPEWLLDAFRDAGMVLPNDD